VDVFYYSLSFALGQLPRHFVVNLSQELGKRKKSLVMLLGRFVNTKSNHFFTCSTFSIVKFALLTSEEDAREDARDPGGRPRLRGRTGSLLSDIY
jgi:hypothetical protein